MTAWLTVSAAETTGLDHSRSARGIDAAGCLILAQHQGQAWVLLGKDRYRRRFGPLAGKRARTETPYQTALREAMEESRGYWDEAFLRAHSDSQQVLSHCRFMLFKVAVPFVPIKAIQAIKIPRFSLKWAPYREITQYAWVSTDALLKQPINAMPSLDGRLIRVHRELPVELTMAQQHNWF